MDLNRSNKRRACKKRIYFIISNLKSGGSERVFTLLLNNLNRDKFRLTLVVLKKEGQFFKMLNDDVEVVELNRDRVRNSFFSILKLIYKRKPDFVVSTLGHLNILVGMIKIFLPKNIIFIARESNTVSEINKYQSPTFLYDIMYRLLYNRFNLIIAQCNFMKNDLVKNYNIKSEKIIVINNPIDSEEVSLVTKMHFYSYDSNFKNILFIGRLTERKRPDHILKALNLIDNKKIRAYFIGEGDLFQDLKSLVLKFFLQDQVFFLGLQSNPYFYIKNCDCVVSTSLFEGFPNVVLEANALGKPVIAYNYPGGIKEIIIDKFNGILVPNGNIEQLAEEISRFNRSFYDEKAIRNYINRTFHKDKIMKLYEDAFSSQYL